MSQRDSGYARVAFDQYETPEWVTQALLPHIPARVKSIWEPACGSGKMSSVLAQTGRGVTATDIQTGEDFLSPDLFCFDYFLFHAVITNPPYSQANEFILKALRVATASKGVVAMLLRTDFDHAKSRRRLFANHRAFAKKVILTKRIKWIENSKGSPSFNHAWFIWDWQHQGAPTIAYHFED